MTRSVLIFAKPPRMGLSKTRLAAGLGKTEAARIARFTMSATMKASLDPRWQTRLYTAPDQMLNETLGGLWPSSLPRFSQGGGDLGTRLTKGLREADRGAVIFVGADTPDISRALVWQAFGHLRRHDAVFGPARDGGFWLFGLNTGTRTPSPFSPVRWSGPHAMADVAANLPAGTRIARLPTLTDIDEAEDWAQWRKTKPTG